jgi:hypothetical protein
MRKIIGLVGVLALATSLVSMSYATEMGTEGSESKTESQLQTNGQGQLDASRFEFRKKKWICLCQLMADADASHKGTWEGRVESRLPRVGVEKTKANNACENATAQHGVDCKKCSCRLEKPEGEKPRGVQVKKVK